MMSRLGISLLSPNRSYICCLTSSRLKASYPIPHDRFRTSLGLPDRLNKTKELQDYADFSYLDGRPTPVTPGQLKKIKRQRELAASAVQHLKEIQFIEDRYNHKVQAAQAEQKQIIEGKLKPKGDALLKKRKV